MTTSQIVSQQQVSLEGVTPEQLEQLMENIIKGKRFNDLFSNGEDSGKDLEDSEQQEEQIEETL